jgi:predicted Zn-dependent peptidase
LSAEEVNRAKVSLKASVSYSLENPTNQLLAMAQDSQNASANVNLEQLFKNIDAVSVNDVNAVNPKPKNLRTHTIQ